MLRFHSALVGGLAICLTACAPEADTADMPATEPGTAADVGAPVDVAAEEQAIRQRVDAWEAAANESGERFASFYAEDGELMAPNAEAARGRQAISEMMGPQLDGLESIEFETTGITVAASGDLAVERGRYKLRGKDASGTAFQDEGNYLVSWRKEGGQWMVLHDIFNSSRPAPGTAQ